MATPAQSTDQTVEKTTNPIVVASTIPPATELAPNAQLTSASSSSSSTPASGLPLLPGKGSVSEKPTNLAAVPVVPPEEEAISYVNQDGDWKSRKINLFKVMRGFVSQLKPGQDLTKISLPAECCTPYGLLEVMGSRELAMFHLTFGMNKHPDDPLERFLAACRFFFGTVRSERFDKKPWNPVLGETHITYADVIYGEDGTGTTETTVPAPSTANSSKGNNAVASSSSATATTSSSSSPPPPSSSSSNGPKSRTIFVGEQVSHHPPVSAIALSNEREQISCQANVSFTVKFGGNQVTVATAGALVLTSKRFNESYELTKCIPDMVVRNVVWGKKYIMWEGDVTMTCPQTGYTAFFKFKEKSSQNVVKGYIVRGDSDDPIIEINGVCGERVTYHHVGGESGPSEPKVLLDLTKEPSARIHYLPKSKLAPLSSVGVWDKVNKAIVDDNITLADKEKKVIEAAQRERSKARVEAKQEYQGYYFDMSPDDGIWVYKNNMDLDVALAEGAHSIDPNPSDEENSSDDEFISQDEPVEPLLASSSAPGGGGGTSSASGVLSSDSLLSDPDRSPITSGDEADDLDPDMTSSPMNPSGSHLEVPNKRRRGSSIGIKTKNSSPSLAIAPGGLAPSSSKKELRAEKKKAREEVKMVVTKMKEEKKKGTTTAALLEGQVHAGWAKVRNLMKKWKDRYIILLPGRLVIFRSSSEAAKSSASGMIMLQGCDVRPRPSKKDGSCFKIYSLNQYPIYSRQGLKGESISSAILPVGADYCILRVQDTATMNVWLDKIRQCIPDWEKNKNLIKAAGLELDSDDSDDESDDSETEPSNNVFPSSSMIASPSSSSIHPSPSMPSLPAIASVTSAQSPGGSLAGALGAEEILNQMGQLYKITKKLSQRQRKLNDTFDEFRTKQHPENITELKKILSGGGGSGIASSSSSSGSIAAAVVAPRKNPFDKIKEQKASGMAAKIKSQLDIKTCVLLFIILYLLIHNFLW
jgi:hypothetical protein